jgi:putative membrane protein
MNALRGSVGLGPVADRLPQHEVEATLAARHVPLAIALRISRHIADARDRGLISDYVAMTLDQNVQLLVDYLGSCERIRKTPLPFAYVVHLRRALILYCVTLPFALVEPFGWWSILVTALISYTFFGIEELGVEIENPFGDDANDLPLEQICETIESDLLALLDGGPSRGESIPGQETHDNGEAHQGPEHPRSSEHSTLELHGQAADT